MEQVGGFAHQVLESHESGGGIDSRVPGSLVSRLRAGNHDAADELVDIYYKQIFFFMRRLGHSVDVSEDLTQESFVLVWKHICQLRDVNALNGWIYGIARNVSRLYWRKHKKRIDFSMEKIDSVGYGEGGVEMAVDRLDEAKRLRRALMDLSFKLRESVVLHYMQGLSISEAAEAAEVRVGTFKSRLSRALCILGKAMGD